MRLTEVLLVVLVALLACGAAAKDNRNLLSVEDVDINGKNSKGKEERANSATVRGGTVTFPTTPNNGGGIDVASFRGGTITFATRPNDDNGGGTVTVTTYNDDGLWQRIKKWWKKLLGREERLRPAARSTGVASNVGAGGIASRVGAGGTGGTVLIDDNNKGGGTVTVTVYNNDGLFQRVMRWWNRIIARVSSTLTFRRLRQLE